MSKTLQHSRFVLQPTRSLYHQLKLSLASLTDIMQTTPEPIAIIGSGCRFPGGSNSPSKLWELLKNLSAKVPSNRFNVDTFYHSEATHHGTTNATKSCFIDEHITQFDAGFFSIQPMESEAIDPQQRLLLETVYDSLCAAGLGMESLRGSSTAVHAGMMCDDWSKIMLLRLFVAANRRLP
ncbi:beta-ketoacyl synthase [Xylaria flabelliformis]|nr:beta-ketoacyl synthase [Xylaria flabelliformis]